MYKKMDHIVSVIKTIKVKNNSMQWKDNTDKLTQITSVSYPH